MSLNKILFCCFISVLVDMVTFIWLMAFVGELALNNLSQGRSETRRMTRKPPYGKHKNLSGQKHVIAKKCFFVEEENLRKQC